MKFKFPLQTVLRYRKTLENLAQRDFQEALGELNFQKSILQEMDEAKAQARQNAFQTQVRGGQATASLVQVEDYLKGQDVRLTHQRAKIQEIEKRVEELREILRTKAIDYKIIEGLKDKRQQEFRQEQNKIEQKRTDENNVMRFRRKE